MCCLNMSSEWDRCKFCDFLAGGGGLKYTRHLEEIESDVIDI
jgi:hypothetical protein